MQLWTKCENQILKILLDLSEMETQAGLPSCLPLLSSFYFDHPTQFTKYVSFPQISILSFQLIQLVHNWGLFK